MTAARIPARIVFSVLNMMSSFWLVGYFQICGCFLSATLPL